MNTVSHHHKNVSKEEGLKIIQTYFHNQVKPTPDDPIDFPPLGQGGHSFHPFDQMANQMRGLTIGPKPTNQSPKWPLANQKPTLSQIVAQNVAQAHAAVSDHGDTLSDHSSESGLCSPKPANCDQIGKPMKQFKGWNLTTEQEDPQATIQPTKDNGGWCPWSTTNFGVGDDEDDAWVETDPVIPPMNTPVDLTFDPIPSLAIGQGRVLNFPE